MLKRIAFGVAVLGLLGACSAETRADKEEVVDETTQEFGLRDTKIAGSLSYGETSKTTQYKFAPSARYVAYKFSGKAGDEIDVWVKSVNGDPVTWILDNDWRVIAKNDDATASNTNSHVKAKLTANASDTRYIVVRDYWLDTMTFKVELKGTAAAPDYVSGCNVDADCTKVQKQCCVDFNDNWTAVLTSKKDAFSESLDCAAVMCPAVMPPEDHSMAQCNFDTKKCELVKPKDIVCQAFSMNPHFCPPNWTCIENAMVSDVGGKCHQNCGGFAGFMCSDPNEECVDNPNDSCDPNNGGADCGGICMPKSATGGCVKTGCSGQICADQDMFSTCEWRDEYACYQTATCERQANGQCGWTQTPALTSCLANN
jgi:hypothetical protein